MEKIKLLLQQTEHLEDKVYSKCEDSAYHDHRKGPHAVFINKIPVSSWSEGAIDFFQSVKISQEQLLKQIIIIQRTQDVSEVGTQVLQRVKAMINGIKHVCRLFEMRSTFEKHLKNYIHSRNDAESLLSELKTLIKTSLDLGTENIPAKMKAKIKSICQSLQDALLKTGINFNNMCAWSMLVQPSVKGNYSWYSFQIKKEPFPRDPWHQYISVLEGNDIVHLAEEALDSVKTSLDIGLVDDKNVQEMEKLLGFLTPDMKLNEEGVLVCFPTLENYVASNDIEEDIENKSIPSTDDLDFLTGEWMGKNEKKVDISEDDFHDAKDKITGPKATSSKITPENTGVNVPSRIKEPAEVVGNKMTSWRKELNLNVGSSDSEDDRASMSSGCASTVGPGSSPAKLMKYAEKKIYTHKRQMKKCKGQESLMTLKSQIKDSLRKIDAFGDPDDDDLQSLYDKLDVMLDNVDEQLDDLKKKESSRRLRPKGTLMTWDGNVDTFFPFKNHMVPLLDYEIKELNISTLKGQIVGPKRKEILSVLHNVTDVGEAWRLLEMNYGDILVVLPVLRAKLDGLPDLPTDEKIEKDSIQDILNYCRTAILYGAKDQIGPLFIQTYREKLSRENRKTLVAEKIMTTDPFIAKLEIFMTTALTISRTSKPKERKRFRLYDNKNMNGGKDGKDWRKCQICSEQHAVFRCPLITEETDANKILEALKKKRLCPKCMKTLGTNHQCPPMSKRYICSKHEYQRCICKCGYKHSVEKDDPEAAVPQVSHNAVTINCVGLGTTGFPTETVVVKHGSKKLLALVTYDSWASHCMLHVSGAKELDLAVKDVGTMDVSCHTGTVEEAGRKVTATIVGNKSDITIDFLLTNEAQHLPTYSYAVPKAWVKKYKIDPNPSSPSGENLVTIGQDAVELWPKQLNVANGVAIYKSRITGNILFSGRAQDSGQTENGLFSNRAVFDLPEQMTTDAIDINPISRCVRCTGCTDCKKAYKPTREKQEAHEKMVKSCLILSDEPDGTQRYTASYPHNDLLSKLPVYKNEVKSMMQQLEKRLCKLNLTEQFNQCVQDFIRRGVITFPIPPNLENLQQSFVPLCYSLKSDPLATTKMRICTNGSFKSGAGISYNETLIPAPEYLNDISGILTRWRAAGSVAIGDVKTCYHKVHSTPLEQSLRRLWIKPVQGMGSEEDFVEACMSTVSFGESLGGPVAQFAIFDTAQSCMSAPVAQNLQSNAFMDDLQVMSYESIDISPLVSEVDSALKQRNLEVKEWIKAGSDQQKDVKYLNYGWMTSTDSIYLRPKINWSKKRRGAREAPDVQNREQLISHIKKYPITKKNLASIVMGTLFDPLGLGQPYNNNLKTLFREVCRLNLDWKEEIPQEIQQKLIEALEFFLTLHEIMFPRRAMYLEAKFIEFALFFDGSPTEHVGVSVIVRNIFRDGTELCRLLLTKAKLGGSDILTAPRAELMACLMSTRLYVLIKEYLSSFLAAFSGEVVFSINGDSSICLAQIQHDSWKFRMWTATRVEEIKLNTKDMDHKLEFYFVPGENNFSDFLTRPYWKSPKEYEEFLKSFCIPAERHLAVEAKEKSLHDLDVKNIYVRSTQVETGLDGIDHSPQEPVNALLETDGLFLPQWSKMQTFVMYHRYHHHIQNEKKKKSKPHLIKTLLEKKSNYFKVRNIIAFMLKWPKKYRKEAFTSLQDRSELKIFELFQAESVDWCKTFRGNGFYTITDNNGITTVMGRKTYSAPDGLKLRLVPPKNILYKRITDTYHQKFHGMQGSPIYIRAQIQRDGYYLPSLIKRLKKLQDNCALCRKTRRKTLDIHMGTVQSKRLTQSAPFTFLQADFFGPLRCKDHVNQRGSRKIWCMILICDFTRYINIVPVESLSATHLMNALRHHTLRFGNFVRMEADLGTNFVGARADIEEDKILESTANEFAHEIQKTGATLIQRSPKSPFITGSAEHSVKVAKKILPTKHTMSLPEWFLACAVAMDLINKRPIGNTNSMESFTPSSIVPVWSEIDSPTTMRGCTEVIKRYKKEFYENWRIFYMDTVLRQSKWVDDSPLALQIGDLVLITDLAGEYDSYMTMGRVTDQTDDSSGVPRYITVGYKRGSSKKEKHVVRTPRSLVFLYRPTDGEEHRLFDVVGMASLDDLSKPPVRKQRVKVAFADKATKIIDK